jgi:hypothetical protein
MNADPLLRYKYAEGLGDLIACTLHSKYVEPFISILFGEKKGCQSCDLRRQALNVLFPIKWWRFFFKSQEERLKSLDEEFDKINLQWKLHTQDGGVKDLKYSEIFKHFENKKTKDPIPEEEEEIVKPDYILMSNSDTEVGDMVIRTIIFKRI